MVNYPKCTVITVNWNGKQHLADCLPSLLGLDYPKDKLEVMVVDNGSTDGSVEFVRKNFPSVRIVESDRNRGFTGGNNLGVKHAKGEIVALINSDARAEKEWLRELVKPLISGNRKLAATSCLSTGWDGKGVDAPLDTTVIGTMAGCSLKLRDPKDYKTRRPVLFPAGNGMAIKKKIFEDVGGFDEDFFMYWEDVDLGWRLWVLGYEILHVPEARIFHKGMGSRKEWMGRIYTLAERNGFFAMFKNVEDDALARLVPAALWLKIRRFLCLTGVNPDEFRIGSRTVPEKEVTVQTEALSLLFGMVQALEMLEKMAKKRKWVQARRKRSDAEIFKLFDRPFDFQTLTNYDLKLQRGMLSAMGWNVKPLKATPEVLRGKDEIIDKLDCSNRELLRKYSEQEQRHRKDVAMLKSPTGILRKAWRKVRRKVIGTDAQ